MAWYNGHPDYADRVFDLSVERVAVVGVGNVAVDGARILCRLPEELAATDIADHALDALRESRVRVVYVLGRRGPAQAAFTNAEVRELGALAGADVDVVSEEIDLDPLPVSEKSHCGMTNGPDSTASTLPSLIVTRCWFSPQPISTRKFEPALRRANTASALTCCLKRSQFNSVIPRNRHST